VLTLAVKDVVYTVFRTLTRVTASANAVAGTQVRHRRAPTSTCRDCICFALLAKL